MNNLEHFAILFFFPALHKPLFAQIAFCSEQCQKAAAQGSQNQGTFILQIG